MLGIGKWPSTKVRREGDGLFIGEWVARRVALSEGVSLHPFELFEALSALVNAGGDGFEKKRDG